MFVRSLKEWIRMRMAVEVERIAETESGPKKTTALAAKYALKDVQEDLGVSIREAKRIIQMEETEAQEAMGYYTDKTGQLNHGGMIKQKSYDHAICKMREILKIFEGE